MDVRALIRIAGPLALTFLLVGVEAVGVSAPVRWGVLLTMTLAWIAYARSTLRPGAGLLVEQIRVLDELRHFIDAEVQGSRAEIERCRTLIAEAANELGRSLESVKGTSRQQAAAVARIVDRRGGQDESSTSAYRLALQANEQVQGLAAALEVVNDQSGAAVSHFDTMACHLDGIFAMLADMQSIADQTHLLARDAACCVARASHDAHHLPRAANDAQRLSERTAAFNEQLRKRAHTSQDSIAHVRGIVGQMASRDFDRSCSAREQAAAMHDCVDRIHRDLGTGMRELAALGRTIDASVAGAMRLLQFDDIATQSLSAAGMHLQRLDTINREAIALQALLHRSAADGGVEMREAVTRLGQRIARLRAEWERPLHKPVRQQSLDAGSVELF